MLLFQLLFLMVCLILIGEPLRVVISRYSGLFTELDVLQVLVIDVYLGGLFLYALAIIPLGLFSATAAWMVTIVFGMLSVLFHFKKFREVKRLAEIGWKHANMKAVGDYLLAHRNALLESIAVLTMFFVAFLVQIVPITNFVLGNISDTSLHGLFVELILENCQIPATHQPYLSAAIIYPQASHVIFAYSSYILGLTPPKVVFYVTPLFNAMTVLAAYYLGKKINPKEKLGLIFAFVIAFVSMWPKFVTWGSNPLIMGFPFFLICLSFLPSLPVFFDGKKLRKILVIGILLGYLASMHLAFYEVIIASAMLWLFAEAARKPRRIYKISVFLVMCFFTILPIAPFLYRYVKYYPYPGHNIGLPPDMVADVTSPPTTHGHPSQSPIISALINFHTTILLNYNVHPNPTLRIFLICLVFASFLTLYLHFRKKRKIFAAEKIALTSIGASILLNLSTYILPAIPWQRIAMILYVSVCLLISTFNIRICPVIHTYFAGFSRKIVKRDKKKVIVVAFMGTLLLFSALYGPFVYYTIVTSPRALQGLYGIYAVTSKSDYELMRWMKYNLSDYAIVLVNPYDSGSFITSASQKKVVYPFSAYLLSYSYRRLVNLIRQGVVNETTYDLLRNFNVTHVFLGSRTLRFWGKVELEENQQWDPMLFLGNPNFKLVKNTDDSYLFSTSHDPNLDIVFQYDFEYPNLEQMNWTFDDIGHGNYSISIDCGEEDNHLLRIMAKRSQSSDWISEYYDVARDKYYATSLERKIYLPKSNITNLWLSFDLNASRVSPPNTVAMSIFDVNFSLGLSFVTPSTDVKSIESLFPQTKFVVLPAHAYGTFNFDLSQIWLNEFKEALPKELILKISAIAVNSSTFMSIDNLTLSLKNS